MTVPVNGAAQVDSASGEKRTPGRPRAFQTDEALDAAVQVFSERGFHATSIADLSDRLGLTTGSIYKAWGDKKGVFLAALDRYVAVHERVIDERIADLPDGRAKLRDVLLCYAGWSHSEQGLRGCLMVGAAVEFATFDAAIVNRVASALADRERRLVELMREARADGSVPARVDPATTARLLLCVVQGMRVVGKTGRTRAEMEAVVAEAMRLLD